MSHINSLLIRYIPSNPDTNWTEESVHISEVSLGRKGVLIIEVSRGP